MQWELLNNDKEEYSPRTGHTVIAYNDAIYVFGGIDEQARQNDLYKYTKEWQRIATIGDPPPPRSGALACMFEDNFYFFGGYTWKQGEYFNDLYKFDPKQNQWTSILAKSPPSARVDHSFCLIQNSAFVFGGSNGLKRFNDLHELNLHTLEWRQFDNSGVSCRFGHTMVAYQQRLYLFGGWDGNSTLNELWVFENGKFMFVKQQNPPAGRYRHTAVVFNQYMIIFGGVDQNQERFNDLQQYDMQFNVWSRVVVQNPPSPRSFHKCVVMNEYMYLVGGFDGQRRNDVHRIKLDIIPESIIQHQTEQNLIQWNPLNIQDKFSPRTGHAVCVYMNKIYLFGGIDNNGNLNNDLYVCNMSRWVKLCPTGDIPCPRSGCKMIVVDDCLLLFGGYVTNNQQHFNDLYRYQIRTNSFSQEQQTQSPSKRTDHSLVEYRGILYVFGGKGENKQILNDLWRFRKEWKQIQIEQFITGRFGHSSIQYQNSMFIFGGWDGTNCLDDFIEFSFVTNIIYEIRRCSGCKPNPRYRHEALVYNDDMYVFGGVDHHQVRYNDLHLYNFKKREWAKVQTRGSIPSPRTFHKIVNIENLLFVIGGYDGQRLNDTYSIYLKPTIKSKFSYPQDDSQCEGEEVTILKQQVRELFTKIQKEEEKHLCKICFSRQIDSVLMECGHFILCFDCTQTLKNCPICRQTIIKVIKTYMF